jgi:hypothetical protein
MKKIIYLYLLIVLSALNSCNTNETNPKYDYNESIDCDEAKFECLNLVRENKNEIKEILLREMERDPNDKEVTLQRISDLYQGYQFSSKFEKYQKILEQNCPEQYKQVNEEMAIIILGEIINKIDQN